MRGTTLPSTRQHASMVTDGKSIYLFGGMGVDQKPLQDFFRLTLSAQNQVKSEALVLCETLEVPSFVQNLSGASLSWLPFESQLIMFGGRSTQHPSDVTYSYDLSKYII